MYSTDPRLEPVLRALANPTRLAVVDRLSRGSASVTELAAPFDMALPSFLQHLDVLEKCGIVHSTKSGRVRTCHLSVEPLAVAEGWLARRRAAWERRMDRFDDYVRALHDKETTT